VEARRWPLEVVSGGQTGVDRAALDVALRLGIPCGGWCPRGRRAEDGRIPALYPVVETPEARYPQRTEWNVRDSDGTLVLHAGKPRGGTALTLRILLRQRKPVFQMDLDAAPDPAALRAWIGSRGIRVLNVAGPRESECPGVGERAARFLEAALRRLPKSDNPHRQDDP
jgi:putative molybdenum carrier protein